MLTVLLLFVVHLCGVCYASDENSKNMKDHKALGAEEEIILFREKIFTQKRKIQKMKSQVADLKLANDLLKEDSDYWKKEIDNMRLSFEGELDAQRNQTETVEKENNILKGKFSEPELRNAGMKANEEKNIPPKTRDPYEQCPVCMDDFLESENIVCPADRHDRVVCEQCHVFHANCLSKCNKNNGCPKCRTKYTKSVELPNPFKVNKQPPEVFAKMFAGLCDNSELISRNKVISAIGPFVTVTKDRDYKNEIDKIIPTRSHFKIYEFQKLTELLGQIFMKNDRNLDFDKNLSELQNYNVVDYFQKELEKEIEKNKEYKMILEALQPENNSSLQKELLNKQLKVASLERTLEEERGERRRGEEDREKLRVEEVNGLQSKCSKAKRKYKEAKAKLVNLERQIGDLQKEKRKSEETEKKLVQETRILRSQKDSHENEKNDLLAKLTHTNELKNMSQSELREAQRENVEKEARLSTQNLEIERRGEEKRNLENQIFCLKNEKRKSEEKERKLEGDVEKKVRALSFQKDKFENLKNELLTKLADKDKLFAILSAEVSIQEESRKRSKQLNEEKERNKPRTVNQCQQTNFEENATRVLTRSCVRNTLSRIFNGCTPMSVIFGIFTFFVVYLLWMFLFWSGFLRY